MSPRAATLADVDVVHALLKEAGVHVERASLARRTEDLKGGIAMGNGATLSWAIEPEALHVYDLAGVHSELRSLVELAAIIAREQRVAVLVCALYEGDPLIVLLHDAGFARDWEESEVQAGCVRTLITFLRVLEPEYSQRR